MAHTTRANRTVLCWTPFLAALLAGPALAGDITISPTDNLQAAINTASGGDTIHLMPGTYNQVAIINGKSITIEGIGGAETTILTAAALLDTVLRIDNAPDPGVTIRGLTIRDGQTPGTASTPDGYPNDGAGVSANASALIIDHCRFIANGAGDDGGAIYSLGGAPTTITDTAFETNTAGPAGGGGGGVLARGPLTVERCVFTLNEALSGGAIYFGPDASGTIDNSTFSQNRANNDPQTAGKGGAVYLATTGDVNVSDSSFTGNTAATLGGAIATADAASAGTLTIERCGFTENLVLPTVTGDAGAVYAGDGVPTTIRECTFVRNSSFDNGGGLYKFGDGSISIERSSFLGNAAKRGGGVRSDSPADVSNCVFVGNQALTGGFGGGIYKGAAVLIVTNTSFVANQGAEPAIGGGLSVRLDNCVVFGNAPFAINTVYSFTYSDVEQTTGVRPGTGNINAAPLFANAPSPGTDAAWGTADDNYGDLRLLAGSPGIDAGDSPLALTRGLSVDLAGDDRNTDDPATPNTGVPAWALNIDMGAYEFQPGPPPPACPADFNNSGSVSVQDIFDFLAAYFAGCP